MKWIRLWPDYIINGTTFDELPAMERGVWFSLLVMAGYSPVPGTVCIAAGIAYTQAQLAGILKISPDALDAGIERLTHMTVRKLTKNPDGTLTVTNWNKYQTEYDRQKGYRRGLQGKVTAKCLQPDTDTEGDIDTDSKNKIASKDAKGNGLDIQKPIDPLWDALIKACGIPTNRPWTAPERKAWNGARKSLADAGATPETITARGRAFRRKWPTVTLTPTALARRWSECISDSIGEQHVVP